MVNDIENFVVANEENIKVTRDSNGLITHIESLVPANLLKFNKTKCKLGKKGFKDAIITEDGESYSFSFKQDELRSSTNFISSIKRRIKYVPKMVSTIKNDIISNLKDKKNNKKVKSSSIKRSNPIGDYNELKNNADKLIVSVKELINKLSSNNKNNSDITFVNYRKKYEEILNRYKFAIKMNDISEMLNVKVKLTILLGKLHAYEIKNNAEKETKDTSEKSETNIDNNVSSNEKDESRTKKQSEAKQEPNIDNNASSNEKEESKTKKQSEAKQEPNIDNNASSNEKEESRTKKQSEVKQEPNIIDGQEVVYKDKNTVITKSVKANEEKNQTQNNDESSVEKPLSIEEKENEFKSSYEKTIEKFNLLFTKMDERIKAAEANLAEDEKNLEKVEKIISDAKFTGLLMEKHHVLLSDDAKKPGSELNMDSREIAMYEEERKDRLKRIEESKKILEQRKKEKENVEKKLNEYKSGRNKYDLPNNYAKEGYIQIIMSREEYSDYLKERELLDKRIALMNMKKAKETEIASLEDKLKQAKENSALLEQNLMENGNSLEEINERVEERNKGRKL